MKDSFRWFSNLRFLKINTDIDKYKKHKKSSILLVFVTHHCHRLQYLFTLLNTREAGAIKGALDPTAIGSGFGIGVCMLK